MPGSTDNPGVIIWPPLLAVAVFVAGYALDWLIPLGLLVSLPLAPRVALGIAVALLGGVFGIAGMLAFKRAHTHVEPWKPALALVTGGVYARLRNPMYLGLGLGTLSLAILAASDWMVVAMVPAAIVLHYGVVLREERYLEATFGTEYRRYRAVVPRYGWRR